MSTTNTTSNASRVTEPGTNSPPVEASSGTAQPLGASSVETGEGPKEAVSDAEQRSG